MLGLCMVCFFFLVSNNRNKNRKSGFLATPRTDKIIKKIIFERATEIFLQNGLLPIYFVVRNSADGNRPFLNGVYAVLCIYLGGVDL